jgi:type VI secretion system protein ImpF
MEYIKRSGAELSFIDRLINVDQTVPNQFRAGLRRDLEDLLNTVIRARGIPEYLDELDHSLINFGIKDLLTTNLSTLSEREGVILYIQKTIEKYEPRLMNISIINISDKENRSHTLALRIIAETIIDDNPEEIIFNSKIDVSTGAVTTNVSAR